MLTGQVLRRQRAGVQEKKSEMTRRKVGSEIPVKVLCSARNRGRSLKSTVGNAAKSGGDAFGETGMKMRSKAGSQGGPGSVHTRKF